MKRTRKSASITDWCCRRKATLLEKALSGDLEGHRRTLKFHTCIDISAQTSLGPQKGILQKFTHSCQST